jgi:hypothetical protein
MATLPIEFEQYQAGSLHEAGHAVIAMVFKRTLVEISILRDHEGDGYVCRERREGSPLEILEEIAIACAGVEAPYLWGGWATNDEHDRQRVEELLRKCPQLRSIDWDDFYACLKTALAELRNSIGTMARELSTRKTISGKDAEEIVASAQPKPVYLGECLASCIERLSCLRFRSSPVNSATTSTASSC